MMISEAATQPNVLSDVTMAMVLTGAVVVPSGSTKPVPGAAVPGVSVALTTGGAATVAGGEAAAVVTGSTLGAV